MKKSLLKSTFITLLLALCSPLAMAADFSADAFAEPDAVESEMNEVQIIVHGGNTVQVKNAEGQIIEVYSITGAQVMAVKVDSSSKMYEITTLQKGCYIVKVGKVTRKIFIKDY